jgi:hypothetical protein
LEDADTVFRLFDDRHVEPGSAFVGGAKLLDEEVQVLGHELALCIVVGDDGDPRFVGIVGGADPLDGIFDEPRKIGTFLGTGERHQDRNVAPLDVRFRFTRDAGVDRELETGAGLDLPAFLLADDVLHAVAVAVEVEDVDAKLEGALRVDADVGAGLEVAVVQAVGGGDGNTCAIIMVVTDLGPGELEGVAVGVRSGGADLSFSRATG